MPHRHWRDHATRAAADNPQWRARRLVALRNRHERVSSAVATLGFAAMTAMVALALQMNLRELVLSVLATTLVAAAITAWRTSGSMR